MTNKQGQGTAGECGFGAVTELNKTNTGSQQCFTCIVREKGGRSYDKKQKDSSQDLDFIFCNT